MNKKLIKHKLEIHSEAWFKHRDNYLGGSEIGAVMGLSPYSCASRVFAEKTGTLEPWKLGNRHTFFGLQMEEIIANAWSHWNPTGEEDNYVQNHRDGKVIRTYKNTNSYIINPKLPWLSVSLDKLMDKNQFKMNGEVLNDFAPIELKTINAMDLAKWESLPTYYLAQLMTQLIVTGCEYGEIVLFDSNKNLHCFPVEYNKEFADQIINITDEFWNKRVVPAKALMLKLNASTNIDERSDIQHEINQLEPPVEATPAYEAFIKDKYKDSYVRDSKEGTMEDWTNAVDYLKLNEEYKELDARQQLYKNNLLKSIGEHEFISFGEDGTVSYSPNKNGSRTLRIKLKN